MRKFKIGQEVKFAESFTIQTMVLKEEKVIKPEDRNFIDKNAYLNVLSGECRGKKVLLPDVEVDNYDYNNISKMLIKKLDYFNIAEELDSRDAIYENLKESLNDIVDKISEVGKAKVPMAFISGYIIGRLGAEFELDGIMGDLEVRKEDVIDELEDLLQDIF